MLPMVSATVVDAGATRPALTDRSLLDLADATRLEELFRVLASVPRLRLMHALVRAGELSLGELASATDTTPQAASNQLSRLADLRVVGSERRGARVFYRLVDPCVAGLLDEGLCLADESARWRR
jgi:DNA-binding transcriptional ArsR family regulator